MDTRKMLSRAAIVTIVPTLFLLMQSTVTADTIEYTTFSRSDTGQSSVNELVFPFGSSGVEFTVDQIGGVTFSLDNFLLIPGNPPTLSVGSLDVALRAVAVGETIAPSTFTGGQSVNIGDVINPGEEFFVGFSDGTDAGYFNVVWDPGAASNLRITTGLIDVGGEPLTVVSIPEPGTLGVVAVFGLIAFARRKRR